VDRQGDDVAGLLVGVGEHRLADVPALDRLGERVVGDQEGRLQRLEGGDAGGVPDRARDRGHRDDAAADVIQQLDLALRVDRLTLEREAAGVVDLLDEGVDGDAVRVLLSGHIGHVEGGAAAPGRVAGGAAVVVVVPTGREAQRERQRGDHRRQAPDPRAFPHHRPPCRPVGMSRPGVPDPIPWGPFRGVRGAWIEATLPQVRPRLSTSARSPSWHVQPLLPYGFPGRAGGCSGGPGPVDGPPYVTYAANQSLARTAPRPAPLLHRSAACRAGTRDSCAAALYRLRGEFVYG
jgi:hypothetical protein